MPCCRSARSSACPAALRPSPTSPGLGKIAALGIKVSRHRTYHGVALNVADGSGALSAHQPLRLRRHGDGGSFYNRRPDNLERSGAAFWATS